MELGDIRGRDNKTGRMRDPWQVLTEKVQLLSGLKAAIQWEKAITCLIVSFETESGEKKQLDFGALIDKKNNIDHWITRPCDDYRDPKKVFE